MKKVILSALVAAAALAVSCSSEQSMVTKGNKSKLDSLSYALGTNVGLSLSKQMSDIPFDLDAMVAGMEDAAFEKGAVTSEQAIQTLQGYFMGTRAQRAQIVESKRAEADSIAMANGATSEDIAATRAALKADADMFESEDQRYEVSYALGVDLGTNILTTDIPVETYWIATAIKDNNGGSSMMDEKASTDYLQNYFTVVRPAELKAISEENLAKIEKKSGVKKTESGLLYRIEVAGDMETAAKGDRDVVRVNYTGRLLRTNKVFDTSRFADRTETAIEMMKAQDPEGYTEDKPIDFPLNRVIPGWTEGMKLVGKGGRISLWIPAELAYGERGTGRDIGPNEALYFDVEVLDVTPDLTPAAE